MNRPASRARRAILLLALIAAAPCRAREVAFTILQTTDLHGALLPSTDYEGREDRGGLLRCATIIDAIRRETPNVLLVDCGDVWVGSIESGLTEGRVVRQALDALRYDAWVPGNHDFDWGHERFRQLAATASMPVLAANIGARDGQEDAVIGLRPYTIRSVDGIRVALIGLTTPGIPTWLLPEDIGPYLFERSVPALRRALHRVRADGAEVLILLVHQGVRPFKDDDANEVRRLAATFPEIDLILGGHTHKSMAVDKLVGETPYLQAAYHGHEVGRADLVYDTVLKKMTKVELSVLSAGPDVDVHPELLALLKPELDRVQANRAEVLGRTENPIGCSFKLPGQSSGQRLLASAIAEATGAEIVFHGVLTEETLPPGPIRYEDVWRLVPYENRIGLLSLTPAQLRALLEENAGLAGSSSFQGILGLSYELDAKAERGRRVGELRLPDGSLPLGRKRYRVAINSYVLASGGGKFTVLGEFRRDPHARYELTDVNTRAAVVEYIRRHKVLRLEEGAEVRMKPAARGKTGAPAE